MTCCGTPFPSSRVCLRLLRNAGISCYPALRDASAAKAISRRTESDSHSVSQNKSPLFQRFAALKMRTPASVRTPHPPLIPPRLAKVPQSENITQTAAAASRESAQHFRMYPSSGNSHGRYATSFCRNWSTHSFGRSRCNAGRACFGKGRPD